MSPVTHSFPPRRYAPELVAQALDEALASASSTPILAISGVQGSGKSTLAAQIVDLAHSRGLHAAAFSIDDTYLTRAQRQRLADRIHPLLATRGPPGTHDLALALATLDAAKAGQAFALPRFDKLADERVPEVQWKQIEQPLDLLVFEGWFLGTPAEADEALRMPLNALERDADAEGTWRHWCNHALAEHYPALWQRFDRLWMLQPPSFAVVPHWRWQQEQALQQASPGRSSMSRPQLERFVQFYERVSRQALRTLPAIADRVIALDAQRQPVTLPSSS